MLSNFRKTISNDVMGIDCSTQTLAFGIISDGQLIKWGEINFEGKNIYERIQDARIKVDALAQQFPVNFVAIEAAVMVRSVQVAIKMAYVFGAVMSSLLNNNIEVIEVAPISWQSGINNKVLSAVEKAAVTRDFPGKSKSWYTNKYRLIRKDRTRQWVKRTFDQDIESDNVTDAIGIAYHAWGKTRRS